MIPTIPEKGWGVTQKPGVVTQTGCVYCLMEGNHGPVEVIYFWMGTSICFNHLPAHAKAHPHK